MYFVGMQCENYLMGAIASRRGSFSIYSICDLHLHIMSGLMCLHILYSLCIMFLQAKVRTNQVYLGFLTWLRTHGRDYWVTLFHSTINMQDSWESIIRRTHRGWYQQMQWFSVPMSSECWADLNAQMQSLNLCVPQSLQSSFWSLAPNQIRMGQISHCPNSDVYESKKIWSIIIDYRVRGYLIFVSEYFNRQFDSKIINSR